ncbi:MAG: IPExxxVDY family protein [Cyclobacteriaceae bacterium]|nr:IPExxxVDY family protein [Cyclobacteriaceae bacterium]
MKPRKLQIDFEFNFDLLGIISSARSYKLAWSINNALSLNLQSAEDIQLELAGPRMVKIANYLHKTENSHFRLIKNKPVDSFGKNNLPLLPELGHLDYLFLVEGETYPITIRDIFQKLKVINTIEYVVAIKVNELKSKENLLF